MLPLLAQLPVDALQLFGFIGSAGALLWIYNQAKTAFGSNPPLHKAFVARTDYDRDQALVDLRLNKATESRGKMHKEIEGLGARATSLEKGERHIEATLAIMDQKLTTLLTRTK